MIARGVRREKSKLAGGIELFSVSEVVIHEGRSEMGVLTSAKLLEHYDAFVKDIELIEMGGMMMRSVSSRAEHAESADFYKLLKQSLQTMQRHAGENSRWKDVLRAWWGINIARISGEEANLKYDTNGEKLVADGRYYWNDEQSALTRADRGRIDANHIKMMRIMASGPAELSLKVAGVDELIDEILYVSRCVEKITM